MDRAIVGKGGGYVACAGGIKSIKIEPLVY